MSSKPVDLANASESELRTVPGIGDGRARIILGIRQATGEVSVDSLVEGGIPRGFLESILQKGEAFISLSPEEDLFGEADDPGPDKLDKLTRSIDHLAGVVTSLVVRMDAQEERMSSLQASSEAVDSRMSSMERHTQQLQDKVEAVQEPSPVSRTSTLGVGRGLGRGNPLQEQSLAYTSPAQVQLEAPRPMVKMEPHPMQANLDLIRRNAPGGRYDPAARAAAPSGVAQGKPVARAPVPGRPMAGRGGHSSKRDQLLRHSPVRSPGSSSEASDDAFSDAPVKPLERPYPDSRRSWKRTPGESDAPGRSQGPAPPKLPTFDGKEGTAADYRAFKSQFDIAAARYRWADEECRDRLIQSLRGTASIFFSRLPQVEQRDYRLLAERLMTRFGKRDPATTVRRKITELRQKEKETLEAYADRVREMTQDGYPTAEPALINVLATDAFLLGCRDKDAAYQTMQKGPDSLDKALEMVNASAHNYRALYGKGGNVRRTSMESDPVPKDHVTQAKNLKSQPAYPGGNFRTPPKF